MHRGCAVSVQLKHLDAGLLLTVHALDELTVLEHLSAHLGGDEVAVVVDVSQMTMAPPADVETLVGEVRHAAARGRHRWSLVSGRSTARRILRQLLAGSAIAVHPSVDAALLALRPGAPA